MIICDACGSSRSPVFHYTISTMDITRGGHTARAMEIRLSAELCRKCCSMLNEAIDASFTHLLAKGRLATKGKKRCKSTKSIGREFHKASTDPNTKVDSDPFVPPVPELPQSL